MSYIPKLYKRIQYSSVSIGGSSDTGNTTITSVDTSKSVVRWLGASGSDQGAFVLSDAEWMAYLELTSATNVRATRDTSGQGPSVDIYFCIIEYQPVFVKSLQRGTIALSTAQNSNTAGISAVVTAQTELVWGGQMSNMIGSGQSGFCTARLELTSTTVITLARTSHNGVDTLTTSYQAIEFR